MNTKKFSELKEKFRNVKAEMLDEAERLIRAFIKKHGMNDTVNIERFFTTPDNQERAEVIYVCLEETDDYFSLIEEPLKTISKSKETGKVCLNDEYMTSWFNAPIVPDLVAALEAIEEDVENGEASFKDGVLSYKEDETE